MDCPQPPRDIGLRNIIDKLAEFVARNGPEFEMITKQKQHGNPKFEFLYGGEHANYYQYRVAAEHAFLKQQGSLSQAQSSGTSNGQTQNQVHRQQFNQTVPVTSGQIQQQQQQLPPADHNANSLFAGMGQQSIGANQLWNPSQAPPPQTGNSSVALNITAQIEAINMQQNNLREQIHQSEANLSAQHSVN